MTHDFYLVQFLTLVAIATVASFAVMPIFYPVVRFAAREAWLRWILAVVTAGVVGVAATFGATAQLATTYRRGAAKFLDTVSSGVGLMFALLFTIAVLAALLPWLLDRLEGRSFSLFVAARHVRAKKSGFLTVISVLSIFAVALSSCALSSTVSVMGGFSADLKRKILGNNAHIVIDTTASRPAATTESVLERVRAVPGVVAATPVVKGEVMASSASNMAGVVVRGIDPATIGDVIDLRKNIEAAGQVRRRSSASVSVEKRANPRAPDEIPADEVIGIGPAGRGLHAGARLQLQERQPRPAPVGMTSLSETAAAPRHRHRAGAGQDAARVRRRRGDAVSPLGDLGPMGVMPKHAQVPGRGDLLQRHVRVRRHPRLRDARRGAELLRDEGADQRRST